MSNDNRNRDQKEKDVVAMSAAIEPVPAPAMSIEQLAIAIAVALRDTMSDSNKGLADALIAAQPPRQLTVDEVSPVSPFNPRGIRNRDLPFVVNQNGVRLNAETLHDAELKLLPLVTAGRYVNGMVTVSVQERGGSKVVNIDHNGATPADRMALKNECRNFEEILSRCVSEAQVIVNR